MPVSRRGRGDPAGELAGIREVGAVAIVVEVVELADVGEARLQHLRIARARQ